MNAAECEQFLRDGVLVIRGALDAATVADLNATYDPHVAGLPRGCLQTMLNDEQPPGVYPDPNGRRFWAPAYQRLVDLPAVEPIVAEIMSDPAFGFALPETPPGLLRKFRMDHDNIHFTRPWDPAGPPEDADPDPANPWDHGGDAWSAGGIVRGGLHGISCGHHVTAVYELLDVPEGVGGFGYVPGSHRLDHWSGVRRDGTDLEGEPLRGLPPWPASYGVRTVSCSAGDCILFSEKLWHTTVPWCGATERRTLFYKYIPWGLHMVDIKYDLTDERLSPRQRELLTWSHADLSCDEWLNRVGEGHAPGIDRTVPTATERFDERWVASAGGGSKL
jgi:hypothetical protein